MTNPRTYLAALVILLTELGVVASHVTWFPHGGASRCCGAIAGTC